jgi:hypothetical protein
MVEEITTKTGRKRTQNYIFGTRNNAVAASRIREPDEGIEPTGTGLLEDPDEIFNHMKKVIGNASKRLICSSTGVMQLVYITSLIYTRGYLIDLEKEKERE